jgi:2-polyprenyl-6-methoxyphenol hydroxylase-like FAD-dependent oxidoreductase
MRKVTVLERDPEGQSCGHSRYIGLTEDVISLLSALSSRCEGLGPLLQNARNQYSAIEMRDAACASAAPVVLTAPGKGVLVDYALLRKCLASSAPVSWSKALVRYEEDAGRGVVRASFQDGSTLEFDYLIGADGARSVVRAQRAPYMRFEDLGFTRVSGVAPWDPLKAAPPVRDALQCPCRVLGPEGYSLLAFVAHSEGRAEVNWTLSYPGKAAAWRGVYAEEGEDAADEHAHTAHNRAQLLRDVVERARAGFGGEVAELLASTKDLGRLQGPRQVYSVGAHQVRYVRVHQATRVYLLGDSGECGGCVPTLRACGGC